MAIKTVQNLIDELTALNKPDAVITFQGNEFNNDDDESDIIFDVLEVWNDGEDSITLFMGMTD
jgi:hypothetical protein